jgi:hypothetical protein
MSFVGPPLVYNGPNAELVNELIAFAFSEQPLSSVGPDEVRDDVVIITNVRHALDGAVGTNDELDVAIEPATMRRLMNSDDPDYDDCRLSWLDLKENLAGEYIPSRFSVNLKTSHKAALERILPLFMAYHERNVPLEDHIARLLGGSPRGPETNDRDCVANEVAADLLHCVKNRSMNGATTNFWESLFQVYLQGLWPCGWQGIWPTSGKFVAWRRRM